MHRGKPSPPQAEADRRPRLRDETLLSLKDAAKGLKSRIAGKTVSYYTVSRWAREGLSGERLETLRIGNAVFTSEEALDRFFAALGDRAEPSKAGPEPPKRRTPKQREAGNSEAKQILERMGVLIPSAKD